MTRSPLPHVMATPEPLTGRFTQRSPFSVSFYLILDVDAHRQSGDNPDALLSSSIHSLLVADVHFWDTSAIEL